MSNQKPTAEHVKIVINSSFLLKVPVFSKFPGKVTTMTIEMSFSHFTNTKKITFNN